MDAALYIHLSQHTHQTTSPVRYTLPFMNDHETIYKHLYLISKAPGHATGFAPDPDMWL